MTESELKKKLHEYAEILVSVIEQSCRIGDGSIDHNFISSYESAFQLLSKDELIDAKAGRINWANVYSFMRD